MLEPEIRNTSDWSFQRGDKINQQIFLFLILFLKILNIFYFPQFENCGQKSKNGLIYVRDKLVNNARILIIKS